MKKIREVKKDSKKLDILTDNYYRVSNEDSTSYIPRAISRFQYKTFLRYIFIFLAILLLAVVILLFVIFGRMWHLTARSLADQESIITNLGNLTKESIQSSPKLTEEMIKRFQTAIQFATVSYEKPDVWKAKSEPEFDKFISFIEKNFPRIHSAPKELIHRERVNKYSLIFIVKGQNDNKFLPPLFVGHLDVVPIEGQNWTVGAFDGTIRNETVLNGINEPFLYGRGTIDNKQTVMGLLEALEYLLGQSNFKPKRSFIIALGHDEELSGYNGAAYIRAKLGELGYTKVDFVLDEGSMVLNQVMPGINTPVALISTAEKGSATIQVNVEVPASKTGHSSMPSQDISAIIMLSEALSRLSKNPLESHLSSPEDQLNGVAQMMYVLLPKMPVSMRMVVANQWLFSSLLERSLSHLPSMNALIRTTTAFTQLSAGIKSNVIPQSAQAIVNHRIHPADSLQRLLEHYKRHVLTDANKEYVSYNVVPGSDSVPTPTSSTSNKPYRLIQATIKSLFPDAVIAANILVGNTDSRHYLNITESVYRFCPTNMLMADLKRFHGPDERISLSAYEKIVQFYYRLISNLDDFEGSAQSAKRKNEL